jgi:CBS domain-containing protein
MTPADFLRGTPPFDRLGAEAMRQVESVLEIAYQAQGARILQRGGAPSRFLYLIRKGIVRLERDGEVLQVLEEGDCFGFPSLLARASPLADAVAAEDTLLYQVPGDQFDRLVRTPAFAEFFLADLTERLRRSAARQSLPIGHEFATPIGRLPTSTPVTVPAHWTVGDAARTMRDRRISSVLVEGAPPGILTDRDLRSRVLAEGLGPDTLVAQAATRPVLTLGAEATLFEALVFMLEHHVHHVPLVVDGSITGIVSDTDLLRLHAKNPLYLLRNVERVKAPEDLGRYASELASMVETMVWGGLGALQVGPVVSRLNDALAARLALLAEEAIGRAPVRYAWIVLGSEGRMEQALLTDQDNALVYEGDGHSDYFAELSARVVHGLIAAGFPECAGGFMATNWHKPLAEWVRVFRGWVETPEPRALVEALSFFDFRPVHGELPLDALHEVVQVAGQEDLFLAHFARASLGLSPPIGAFRQLRPADDGVDVKKGGLAPIVSLARLYALQAGTRARSTIERLKASAASGMLSRESAETLEEGFRFLQGLRLRGQLRALRAGEPLGNRIRLEDLSPIERRHLKEVFLAIREVQRATASRYAIQRLA